MERPPGPALKHRPLAFPSKLFEYGQSLAIEIEALGSSLAVGQMDVGGIDPFAPERLDLAAAGAGEDQQPQGGHKLRLAGPKRSQHAAKPGIFGRGEIALG